VASGHLALYEPLMCAASPRTLAERQAIGVAVSTANG